MMIDAIRMFFVENSEIVSIVFATISAIAWFASAVITPSVVKSYWGGPPHKLIVRMRLGSSLNAIGALFASFTMIVQVISFSAG